MTSHVVKLTGLIPGATYYYLVGSADAAGNTATDNNAGAYSTIHGRGDAHGAAGGCL